MVVRLRYDSHVMVGRLRSRGAVLSHAGHGAESLSVTLGRPLTFPEPWLTLAKQAGGVAILAQRLGVSRRTLERWAHGTQIPREMARRIVNAYAENRGVEGPYTTHPSAP